MARLYDAAPRSRHCKACELLRIKSVLSRGDRTMHPTPAIVTTSQPDASGAVLLVVTGALGRRWRVRGEVTHIGGRLAGPGRETGMTRTTILI